MSAVSMISVMQPVLDKPQPTARLSTRPQSLSGRSVAFLDEGGPNADIMLDQMELELIERASIGRVVRAKVHGQQLNIQEVGSSTVQSVTAMAGQLLNEVPKWADAAVVGVGY